MKIALIPGAFKPYHMGHDDLVRIASREVGSDGIVKLFVSLGDRGVTKTGKVKPGEFVIYGDRMRKVWDTYLRQAVESSYPNVEVIYAIKSPVAHVFDELKENDGSSNEYIIYSDTDDISTYKDATLRMTAPNLFSRGLIVRRGVERGVETINLSGTKMRGFLVSGDTEKFSLMLPNSVRQYANQILNMLRGDSSITESLLRNYVRLLLSR